MSDALLPYYNRELDALRRLAAEFAETYPKIAGRLRLSRDAVDDPHVARLLEGVAFLGARVQHRLDDEFPELTDALLSVLYPHYLAPVPSVAITRFSCDPEMAGPALLRAGAEIETEPVRGEPCRFRTAYDVTLWPVEIDAVRLSGMPLPAPSNPAASQAAGVMRISLRCANPAMTFSQLGLDSLRLFLRGETGAQLLELMLAHCISVAVADGPGDQQPVILPPSVLQAVGFAPEEALLPWPARSFSGFRLLSEYFAAREKFLFVDILRLDAKTLLSAGNRMDVFLYLDRLPPELERAVDASSLALGCTPMVNLFAQRCEPITLDSTALEYRIVPDARRPQALEVWSVERLREGRPGGGFRRWEPFYRLARHGDEGADEETAGQYMTARRPSPGRGRGSEVFLLPHDPAFEADRTDETVLSVDALCCNRDLPAALPFGGGRPALRLVEGAAVVTGLSCLTAPTSTMRMPLRERSYWRLISHLSLGHLSVVGGGEAAKTLAEVLRLYDGRDTAETRAAIRALLDVSSAPGTARVPGARAGGFCRGLDVTLTFDDQLWSTGGLFVLASVLERFLALHATVNSFVRTRAVLRGRPGTSAAWPARAGRQVLL
ncbi:type VI secretion system baseplate subunit TssF [Roseomonas xinghualingensis]|uniref:type VI secretion system baseplate subunit TssF n=1 Tax=Roseomonas xinghualingensis TaxID=2986475 RepID=UPI0021F1D965|nr:type VI secretion system baseplate subunit TssF [Roseomonas sp. SXEYE001]MCV4209667.1 type VI secretion system baseplate subunit TssF [Roseomonas sp. SXEYE001]